MKKKIAFVIGNGPSRKPVDLHDLHYTSGLTFGCNALYRECKQLDFIVAIDDGMIKELQGADLGATELVIPPEDERWEHPEFNVNRRRSNAGMNAMSEAITQGCNILYCLGFDFLLGGEASVDNIFKGTKNYGKETAANVSDNNHRARYLEWFAKRNPDIQFVMVVPDGEQTIMSIDGDNIFGMAMDTFLTKLEEETNVD